MADFLHIIHQAYNRPVLLEPEYASTFYSYLSQRIGAESLVTPSETLDIQGMKDKAAAYSGNKSDELSERKTFQFDRGVATIPIVGTLVNRGSWMSSSSGLTSYQELRNQIKAALSDPEVDGIFFDISSPGGAVAGCFDLADWIAGIPIPTACFVDESATSAAYALASQCDAIYLPRTGVVGSVGVLLAHYDQSKRYESAGVKVTLIHSGKHKIDGNPFEELPTDVRAKWQIELDDIRNLFAETVARGRKIEKSAVLSTEAAVYTGQAALDIGFADALMSKPDAFEAFISTLTQRTGKDFLGESMTIKTQPVRAETDNEPIKQDNTIDRQSEASTAVKAESERIYAIIGCEEAAGKTNTALALAKSGMDADAAKAVLASIPIGNSDKEIALKAMADAEQIQPKNSAASNQPPIKFIA